MKGKYFFFDWVWVSILICDCRSNGGKKACQCSASSCYSSKQVELPLTNTNNTQSWTRRDVSSDTFPRSGRTGTQTSGDATRSGRLTRCMVPHAWAARRTNTDHTQQRTAMFSLCGAWKILMHCVCVCVCVLCVGRVCLMWLPTRVPMHAQRISFFFASQLLTLGWNLHYSSTLWVPILCFFIWWKKFTKQRAKKITNRTRSTLRHTCVMRPLW